MPFWKAALGGLAFIAFFWVLAVSEGPWVDPKGKSAAQVLQIALRDNQENVDYLLKYVKYLQQRQSSANATEAAACADAITKIQSKIVMLQSRRPPAVVVVAPK